MTTTETMTTTLDGHPVCTHCGGSGREPIRYTGRARAVLDKLAELGAERKSRGPSLRISGRRDPKARAELDKLYDAIRRQIALGASYGVRTPDMMAALGLTSPAYYKIKNGQTGA